MSKKLFVTRNIGFVINIILLIICMSNHLFDAFEIFPQLIILIIGILFIITVVDIIKKKENANNDLKYNIIFNVVNLIVLFILLRGVFDMSISLNTYYLFDSEFGSSNRMVFVANNLVYFNVMYVCLIIYRITLNNKKTKEKNTI